MNRLQSVAMKVFLSGLISFGLGVSAVQAQSGSLEPPATAVDGSGLPVATTQTQPSWDQDLPVNERFVRVLPTAATPEGEGVLDRETGLVWEQSPHTSLLSTWHIAKRHCLGRSTGEKKGWRLPSIYELGSLIDPTNSSGDPDLPAGHPFNNVISTEYYSSSASNPEGADAWFMDFNNGGASTISTNGDLFAWCVRGQGGLPTY